jgi:hypothetical protein
MQRAGKTHKAAASDGLHDMKLKNFFRECKNILKNSNEPDSAFYFEQLEEHMMSGKPLPSDSKEISRVLGL